jgi:predicted lysophospholipase L1 biosynthesis ABC-type transport system permease subunit
MHTANLLQVVLIIRFSVIPSHISTAVFSTCHVKFWHFAVATFLTLPKQIILVYLGVLLVQESKDNTINIIVLVITFLITVFAAVYIYWKMRATKKTLLEEQAARLQLKALGRPTATTLRRTSTYTTTITGGRTQSEERFWETDRVEGNRTPVAWQHDQTYRIDDDTRRPARMQEFI